MKNETLKSCSAWPRLDCRTLTAAVLQSAVKEVIKSFTVHFIISVFTGKRAVTILGLFYLCLFILFHCLYKSPSHFVLLGFCPFQLLTGEWGRQRSLADKLGREGSWKLSFCANLFPPLGGTKPLHYFFPLLLWWLWLRGTLGHCCLHDQAVKQHSSLAICMLMIVEIQTKGWSMYELQVRKAEMKGFLICHLVMGPMVQEKTGDGKAESRETSR